MYGARCKGPWLWAPLAVSVACSLDQREVDTQSLRNAPNNGGSSSGTASSDAGPNDIEIESITGINPPDTRGPPLINVAGATGSGGSGASNGGASGSGASNGGASGSGAAGSATMVGGGGAAGAGSTPTGAAGTPAVTTTSLSVAVTGDGFGDVRVNASGGQALDCGAPPCVVTVTPGTSVTVTAAPRLYSVVQRWSEPACSNASSCTVTAGASGSLSVEFRLAYDVAFTSSVTYLPNQLPRPGAAANAECARLAAAGGIHGNRWVAWLSTAGATAAPGDDLHAVDQFQRVGGWLRTDGQLAATSLAALTSGQLLHPINRSELRGPAPQSGAWSATGVDGRLRQNPDGSSIDCNNWTSTDSALFGGDVLENGVGVFWTGGFTAPCDEAKALVCFGDDSDAEVPIEPVAGRLVFLSATDFVPGGGLAAADALCQREACEAGLTGGDCAQAPGTQRTFRSYLHTQNQPAWERFDLTRPTWVRPDGVQWLPSATDLSADASGELTTVNVTLDLQYLGGPRSLWIGDPAGQATCSSWASTTGTGNRTIYDIIHPGGLGSQLNTADCSFGGRILCLEQ